MGDLRNLSPRSAAILRAVIAAIRPRGHGFDQPIDEEVLLELDRTFPYFPPSLGRGLILGIHALEWAPILFERRAIRLTRMRPDDAQRYLSGWLHSRNPLRRNLVLGLKTLISLAFYQHPTVLAAMEVRWQDRVAETTRLRAETLGAPR